MGKFDLIDQINKYLSCEALATFISYSCKIVDRSEGYIYAPQNHYFEDGSQQRSDRVEFRILIHF